MSCCPGRIRDREMARHDPGHARRLIPVVFRHEGFRFFFYANEGDPREPVHVHVEKDDVEAKFWLHPEVSVAYNDGFNARTLGRLIAVIEANRQRIMGVWDEFFA